MEQYYNTYNFDPYEKKESKPQKKNVTQDESLTALLTAVSKTLQKESLKNSTTPTNQNNSTINKDEETLTKKHKTSKDSKQSKNTQSQHNQTNINENQNITFGTLGNTQQEINDLPHLVPLSSFASQTPPLSETSSSASLNSENLESKIGNEQRKDEEKVLQKVIDNVKTMRTEIKNSTNPTNPTTSSTSENTSNNFTNNPTKNIENLKDSRTADNSTDNTNTFNNNIMEENKTDLPPDIFNYDDLIVNLKFLACVGKGEKLSSSTGNLDTDKKMFGTVTRWWWNEGRDQTHEAIKKLIKSAEFHSEMLINMLKDNSLEYEKQEDIKRKLDTMTTDLSASKKGIRNLVITYRDDDVYLAKLDVCWDEISVRTYKNMNLKR